MKLYNHSYLLPGEAEKRLYEAQQLLKSDNRKEALQRVNEARALLVEYLAKDNVEEIKDGTGFLRQSETFDDWQIFLIRETFAKKLEADTYSPHARQYLDIINICQLQSGFPEFESVQHFTDNRETFWADIRKASNNHKTPYKMENLESTFAVVGGNVYRIISKAVAQVCDIATGSDNPDIFALQEGAAVSLCDYLRDHSSRAGFWELSDTFGLFVASCKDIARALRLEGHGTESTQA